MIVYKLVKKNYNNIFESPSYCLSDHLKVIYQIGKVATPTIPNSKLFCFASKEQALIFKKEFIYDYDQDLYVLECETPKCYKLKLKRYPTELFDMERLWKFIKNKKRIPGSILSHNLIPTGTVFCDSVIPIRVV